MYVCMYVCMYICMYVCMYVCVYIYIVHICLTSIPCFTKPTRLVSLLICPEIIYTPIYAPWGPRSIGPICFCKSNSDVPKEPAVEYVNLSQLAYKDRGFLKIAPTIQTYWDNWYLVCVPSYSIPVGRCYNSATDHINRDPSIKLARTGVWTANMYQFQHLRHIWLFGNEKRTMIIPFARGCVCMFFFVLIGIGLPNSCHDRVKHRTTPTKPWSRGPNGSLPGCPNFLPSKPEKTGHNRTAKTENMYYCCPLKLK